MLRLLRPFDLGQMLALNPSTSPENADQMGAELASPATVFREADFIAINCPLNDDARGMIDADLFSLMKPTARKLR